VTGEASRRSIGLSQPVVVAVILAVIIGVAAIAFVLQSRAEHGAFTPVTGGESVLAQRQIDKLDAEIRQIRSDTSGSLFWLELAALFVTVGAAVGGYLLGQTRTTLERAATEQQIATERAATEQQIAAERLAFERSRNVDAIFQGYVQELCDTSSPLLRVAAAMKLGKKFIESPPVEWRELGVTRLRELSQLTQQVLAASLSIELEPKVLKAVTIAIALPASGADHASGAEAADLRGLDLSLARAADAYWAKIHFDYADFYRADLSNASLRNAHLQGAQFREATLQDAVLVGAACTGTNFKLADLRGADLSDADLEGAKFEDAKVFGVTLARVRGSADPDFQVDYSPEGDGTHRMSVGKWLTSGRNA
jgi:uncharacterized protein YjbI with pentapeptide repeats